MFYWQVTREICKVMAKKSIKIRFCCNFLLKWCNLLKKIVVHKKMPFDVSITVQKNSNIFKEHMELLTFQWIIQDFITLMGQTAMSLKNRDFTRC